MKNLKSNFEFKSLKSDGTFTGYASIFGEHDYHDDIVVPGAFQKSLSVHKEKNRKIPMLWQHNSREPIGVYPVMVEDEKGLYVEGELNMKVQRAVEAHALMDQGALTGLSIGYTTERSEWDEKTGIRRLIECNLFEVSPVTFPAGDSARVVAVKDLETVTDVERALRDAGFSRKEAMTLIAKVKASQFPSDSEEISAIRSIIQNL